MGSFKFEDDHRYMMPAHFGGTKHVSSTTVYRDVTNLVVQYRTRQDAIEGTLIGLVGTAIGVSTLTTVGAFSPLFFWAECLPGLHTGTLTAKRTCGS